MGDVLKVLKQYYELAVKNDFVWFDLYSNNVPCNGKEGIYTYFWIKKAEGYEFIKYTIQYEYRVDDKGMFYPKEGIKYYVAHEYRNEYDGKYKIPTPSNEFQWKSLDKNEFPATIVNSYGRYRHVFDDVETAKKHAASDLLHIIYSYTYLLSEEEQDEWNCFVESHKDLK